MKNFLAGATVACILASAEILRELHTFEVRHYSIPLPKMKKEEKRKVLFLTDLHGKEYGKENRRLIKKIREEKPDYILIGGDMLTRTKKETEQKALRLFSHLAGICPVYAANGNHEQKMKENLEDYGSRYEKYKEAVKSTGVHLLENDSVSLHFGEQPVKVTGLEIPLSCYSRVKNTRFCLPIIRPLSHSIGSGGQILCCPDIFMEESSESRESAALLRRSLSCSQDIPEIYIKKTDIFPLSAKGLGPTRSMSVSLIRQN